MEIDARHQRPRRSLRCEPFAAIKRRPRLAAMCVMTRPSGSSAARPAGLLPGARVSTTGSTVADLKHDRTVIGPGLNSTVEVQIARTWKRSRARRFLRRRDRPARKAIREPPRRCATGHPAADRAQRPDLPAALERGHCRRGSRGERPCWSHARIPVSERYPATSRSCARAGALMLVVESDERTAGLAARTSAAAGRQATEPHRAGAAGPSRGPTT